MSDSQSAGIPAGLGNLEGSKESVSTENDTEADIEDMSSIADYEAPFAPDKEDVAAPKEESKPKPITSNTTKKEPSVEQKKEAPSTLKVEPPSNKKEVSLPEKSPQVTKEQPPSSTPKEPSKASSSSAPAPQSPVNTKQDQSKKEAPASQTSVVPELESASKEVKTPPREVSERSSRSRKNRSSSEKIVSERTGERKLEVDNSGASEQKSGRSSPSQTKTNRSRSTRKDVSHPKSAARSKSEALSYPISSYEGRRASSDRISSNHLQIQVPQFHSSSCTSYARAETTPEEEEGDEQVDSEVSLALTEDIVSVSVSSGLESLREIFFDEHDSHKGYLTRENKELFDNSYCSHEHRQSRGQLTRISDPSFNSHHLDPTPAVLSDLDQVYVGTIKDNKESSGERALTGSDLEISPVDAPVMTGGLVKVELSGEDEEEDAITPKPAPVPTSRDKKVEFVAGDDVISLTLDENTDNRKHSLCREHDIDDILSIASEDIVKAIDRKYISFTPNTLLCDISNIVPNHKNLVRVEGRHILNKEVCVEFMCWLENLNDLFMSPDWGRALNIFRRQESRFKIVLYECLKVAQGCGLDIGFERVAAMAHIAFDIVYSMLPYCDGIKWYSQMVAGARRTENRLAEAYMLLCAGQIMVYGGDAFEAQRHLKTALLIVKQEFAEEQDLYNSIKHLLGFSVALCDCSDIVQRESGLIKMTEALVMTRNLYGASSLETALGRLHIGIAYRALYEDTALRLEGLDYVERAHEVLEDKLGHHPYMALCVQTLAQYHDDMININFSAEYNQALKCYKLATEIHQAAVGGHNFTVRALTQMGDFYHRMADYTKAGDSLTEAYEMAITYCPTDIACAAASFHLGLLYMDDSYPQHDIFRGQTLLTSAANLLSKYGVTYQRATMLQHMGIASEEAGLKHTFYKQESENIKSVMFGAVKG